MINNISIVPKVFTNIHFKSKEKINLTQPEDIFIKNSTNTKEIEKTKILEYANKLFDQIYDEHIEQTFKDNPELKGLTIEKPQIMFKDEDENTQNNNIIATYNFANNRIEIAENFNDNYYLLMEKDTNENLTYIAGICKESELNENKENGNIEAIKLNDKEKEIFLKSVFVHEFRHFIQEHLMESTKNVKKRKI